MRQEHQAKDNQPESLHSTRAVLHIARNCQHLGGDQKFVQDKDAAHNAKGDAGLCIL